LERRVNPTFPFNINKFKEGILGWFGKEKIIHRKIAASELLKAGYSPPEKTNPAESALAYLENNKDRIFPYKTILGAAHNLRIYPAGNDQYQIKIE